jgi:hypothetical protein
VHVDFDWYVVGSHVWFCFVCFGHSYHII